MQKVEGSSPFSRFPDRPANQAFLRSSRARLAARGGRVRRYGGIRVENRGRRGGAAGMPAARAPGAPPRTCSSARHGARPGVEHLLVDGHREAGVGVAHQVHRAPRRHVADREDRGEGAPQRVRRHVRDRRAAVGLASSSLARRRTGVEDARAHVVGPLRGAVARRERGSAAPGGCSSRCSASRSRNTGRAAPRARPRRSWWPRAGMRTRPEARSTCSHAQPAELAHAQAGQDQRLHDQAARNVVAIARRGVSADPELAAADLSDQRVRDAELARQRAGRGAGGADRGDRRPGQSAMLGLEQLRRPQDGDDLLGLEVGAPRALGLRARRRAARAVRRRARRGAWRRAARARRCRAPGGSSCWPPRAGGARASARARVGIGVASAARRARRRARSRDARRRARSRDPRRGGSRAGRS